jgi:hypothetical protein
LFLPALALASPPKDEVMALHQEIAALKLDRALNLTQAQARALLPLLRERAAAFEQMKAQREQNRPAMIAALTRARDELRSTGAISSQTEELLRQTRGEPPHAQMKQFREKVMQVLTPEQLEAAKNLRLEALAARPEPGGFGGREHEEHFGKMGLLHHVAFSETFVGLVESRAR